MELKKLINISTCMRGQRLHFWSELSAKSSNYLNQYSDKKCVADFNHIQSDTHIYPISELGQGTVDYWTHLMLKTNTSYFTGSSQLNKRFFFHICNTLRNIHSHGCIQTISLFWFYFNNIKSTDCMHHPFVWQWSR